MGPATKPRPQFQKISQQDVLSNARRQLKTSDGVKPRDYEQQTPNLTQSEGKYRGSIMRPKPIHINGYSASKSKGGYSQKQSTSQQVRVSLHTVG